MNAATGSSSDADGADESQHFEMRGELRPALETMFAGDDQLCLGDALSGGGLARRR